VKPLVPKEDTGDTGDTGATGAHWCLKELQSPGAKEIRW